MKNSLKYLISILVIIIFVFAITPKGFQNDTFYLIALGKQIKQTGIDGIDHFSWHTGLKYTYPHWAFDLICSGINNLAGLVGLEIFTSLCASIFMLLIFWYLLKIDVNWLIAFISTLFIAFLAKDGFICRGQIISYPLLFIELLCIERFNKKPDILSVIGVFVTSCIIANVHATIWIFVLVLFLPVIGEYVTYSYTLVGINERLIKRNKRKLAKAEKKDDKVKIEKYKEELKHQEEFKREYKPSDSRIIIRKNENIKWIWILVLAAIIGGLCTPIKDIPFTYYLRTSLGTTLTSINEHLPTMPATDLGFFIFSSAIVLILLFTEEKFVLRDVFLLAGVYLMALLARRHVTLLILLCSFMIARSVDRFIKFNIEKNKSNDIDEKRIKKSALIFFGIICVIALGISIFFFIVKSRISIASKEYYPTEAVKYIKENLDYKKIKLYNEYDYGSYLMYNDIPVFIDSRSDLYTAPFNKGVKIFDDYIKVKFGKKSLASLLNKYDIEYVLMLKSAFEYNYVKEDYRFEKLYSDKYFVIYRYEAK